MMKKITLVIMLLSVSLMAAKAINTDSKIWTEIEGLKQMGEIFHPVQVLKYKETTRLEGVGDYAIYEINNAKLLEAFQTGYNSINFILPLANGKSMEIYLTKNEIFTSDLEITTTNEQGKKSINPERGNLYHGVINTSGKLSLACVSIFRNELSAVICDDAGNWNLGKLDGRHDNEYAYFNDCNFHLINPFKCETVDEEKGNEHGSGGEPESMVAIKKCVRIFIDCDYDFFVYKGNNINNEFNYVQNLFNVSSTIYGQEDVSISISSLNFWTGTDPFGGSSSTVGLNDFSAYYTSNSFNGDNALLLAHDGGNGGLANLPAICNGFAYTDINGNYTASSLTFPTYTWDANVFTHELGHNFGSHHTHWCGWSGGPIDNCNTYWGSNTSGGPLTNSCSGFTFPLSTEGGCSNGPSPGSSGGTIMSYCHGCYSIGVNIINGFGTQPGNAIRSYIAGKACLTNCSGVCRLFTSVGVPITTGNNLTFQSGDVTFGSNTVESGATATFNGGYLVMLNPGFFAQDGCTFHATIASCTPLQPISNNMDLAAKNRMDFEKDEFTVFPNPFSNQVTIHFNATKETFAQISMYDVTGRKLKAISNAIYNEGNYNLTINVSDMSAGIYVVVLQTADFKKEQKLIKTN